MNTTATANIASELEAVAGRIPDSPAVIECRRRSSGMTYRRVSFGELLALTDRYAHALADAGVTRGCRTIVLVKPGVDLFALTFALFKIGAVPVLIDPGMGTKNMVRCLGRVEAEAMVAIPAGHVLRLLHRRKFAGLRVLVTVGPLAPWGGTTLQSLAATARGRFPTAPTRPEETAAILFTSGSTGPPRGAVYRHETFLAQVSLLRTELGFREGETDVATFPLFALFDAALGVTCVIPDMDATRPGSVDPRNIIDPVLELGATSMFGSPALLERVAGGEDSRTMPGLERVISAGAPVHRRVLEAFASRLRVKTQIFTPYGATEALPVAVIGSHEILSGEAQDCTAAGRGVCVGRPVAGMTVRILGISDDPILAWDENLVLPTGEIGEIVVSGPVVTHEYFGNPAATRLAKIVDGERVWHRMGDLGSIDVHGRIWFAGRKAHRVTTEQGELFSVPCEAIFNAIPGIRRTALVGAGQRPRQEPVLFVELLHWQEPGYRPWSEIEEELPGVAGSHPTTDRIEHFTLVASFPVDIRHNAKIFRERLAPEARAVVAARGARPH